MKIHGLLFFLALLPASMWAGSLSCTGDYTSTTRNLSALAGAGGDWFAYYNLAHAASQTPYNKKNTTNVLGGFAITGPNSYDGDPRGLTFTDGRSSDDGGAAQTAEARGMYTQSLSSTAIQFTGPADTGSRTLYIFLSMYQTTGGITVHLSDGSAPDYTNTHADAGSGDANYTCTYAANSAGQTVQVTYRNTGTGGTVNINGGALTAASGGPAVQAQHSVREE